VPPGRDFLQATIVRSREYATGTLSHFLFFLVWSCLLCLPALTICLAVDCFRYAGLQVQEMELRVDDLLLQRLLRLAGLLERLQQPADGNAATEEAELEEEASSAGMGGRLVYLEVLHVGPLKATFSFRASAGAAARERAGASDSAGEQGGGAAGWIAWLLARLGPLANVDDVPVRMNALLLTHPFVRWVRLARLLGEHYSREALGQVYKVHAARLFSSSPHRSVMTIALTPRAGAGGLGAAGRAECAAGLARFGRVRLLLRAGCGTRARARGLWHRRRQRHSQPPPQHALRPLQHHQQGSPSFSSFIWIQMLPLLVRACQQQQ
jgi:hypothetical protein